MRNVIEDDRLIVMQADRGDNGSSFPDEVRIGLTRRPKRLPCRFIYDAEGSRLFEEVCAQPEYYPPRAEAEILRSCAPQLARQLPEDTALVELGSGSAKKTRIIIDEFATLHDAPTYMPIDISPSILKKSSRELLSNYETLRIRAVAAEYRAGLAHVFEMDDRPKLIVWLGSSVGNFERTEAARFLMGIRREMRGHDRLLIGMDLRKDRAVIEPAYNDANGVTARFNKNLLARVNRELGGQFDLASFSHRAVYNEEQGRVESYLVSTRRQDVAIEHLDLMVSFDKNEAIHTENSYKFTKTEIEQLARSAGFHVERHWLDSRRRFSLNLLAPTRMG